MVFFQLNVTGLLFQSFRTASPTKHYRTMRRPLIRLVDDVTLVRNLEIDKFQDKKDHEDDSVSQNRIHIISK